MLKNRIGNNSKYDEDMELIENMVLYTKNKDNNSSLYLCNYYNIKAQEYWNGFIEYLYDENSNIGFVDNRYSTLPPKNEISKLYNFKNIDLINKDNNFPKELIDYVDVNKGEKNKLNALVYIIDNNIKQNFYDYLIKNNVKNNIIYNILSIDADQPVNIIKKYSCISRESKIDYIKENIKHYSDIFYEKLNKIKNSTNLKIFDNLLYYNLFYYISILSCLDINFLDFNDDIYGQNSNFNEIDPFIKSNIKRVYILANGTGKFALNTWLYSFFEGIILIGSCIRDQHVDGINMCAFNMLYHDIIHNKIDINKKNYDDINLIKNLYYQILNSNFSTQNKELFILLMWINIHESMNVFITFYEDINFLFKKFLNFFNGVGNFFITEIKKYYYLTEHINEEAFLYSFYLNIYTNKNNNIDIDLIGCLYYIFKNIKNLIYVIRNK